MGIGRIASFLSSLSPAADSASAVSATDHEHAHATRQAESSAAFQDRERQHQQGSTSEIAQQLQSMIAAVRTLNDNAAEQGAALPVSQTGAQLRNAVSGLGHLLSALDPTSLSLASAQVREAGHAVDAVETGLAGIQASAEQMFRSMSAEQAQQARAISDRFQSDMKDAVARVRGAIGQV